MLEALPAAICILDERLKVRFRNALMASMIPGGDFGKWPPDLRSALAAPIDEALREDHYRRNIPASLRNGCGHRFVLGSLFPYEWGSGRGVGLMLHDASEFKAREDKLRKTRRAEMIGRLAGGVAHNFNNLLTSILGNACLLAETLDPNQPEAAWAREIVRASESAAEVTRNLLAFAGKGAFVHLPVRLADLLRDNYGSFESLIPPNVRLSLHLADEGVVAGDPDQLKHLVTVLLVNAVEAIGAAQSGCIEVSLSERPDALLCLTVRDNGRGMEPALVGRIFEPFFTTKFPGRGLGLAAAYGIVKSLRGHIDVITQPGEGTTFEVLLPPASLVERSASASAGIGAPQE